MIPLPASLRFGASNASRTGSPSFYLEGHLKTAFVVENENGIPVECRIKEAFHAEHAKLVFREAVKVAILANPEYKPIAASMIKLAPYVDDNFPEDHGKSHHAPYLVLRPGVLDHSCVPHPIYDNAIARCIDVDYIEQQYISDAVSMLYYLCNNAPVSKFIEHIDGYKAWKSHCVQGESVPAPHTEIDERITATKAAKRYMVKVSSLREEKSKGRKSVDEKTGVDNQGRRWRKKEKNVVEYFFPSEDSGSAAKQLFRQPLIQPFSKCKRRIRRFVLGCRL